MTPQELEALQQRVRDGDLFALGAKPSGVRTSDYVVKTTPHAAPPSFTHPAHRRVPVKSQQGGTCVGNSIATCMTYLEWVEKNDVVAFDGEELNMRVVGREYGQGAAAMPQGVLEDVRLHGAQAPDGLYFPRAYGWVDWSQGIQAIKDAMSAPGNMVTAAIWLTSEFSENPTQYLDDAAETTPKGDWGYHEIVFAAYNDLGVTIQNSWDTWWGAGGFRNLSWRWLLLRLGECWAITDNADTAKDGFVKTYDWGNGGERAIKRANKPAVYLLKSNGRIWITDPWQAKRFGVDLTKVEVLPDTAKEWERPVIGPDAPRDQR